ncbi:MAG: hypothetical protein LBB94_11435 [Clostridiales bacterium]|jgi:TrmH family RNA methyltransferase|nr:hypothetical protein [Clostridiales bacterium]
MSTRVVSARNAGYQKFEVLKTNRNKRHRYGEFIVEGVRNINEAVKNNWRINSFIYSYEQELSEWAKDMLCDIKTEANYELSGNLMSELSGKDESSELMAVINMRSNAENEKEPSANPIFALFDRPSNKGNLGTLLRSCDAFGVEKLIITGHAVDIYEPDVISASMGSFFRAPFIRLSDNAAIDKYITDLKQKYPQMRIVGTTSHMETDIYKVDMTGPVLFLIGNETDGLNWRLKEISDVMATIPMDKLSSASSFNVSCAATVMFYEANRQRSA